MPLRVEDKTLKLSDGRILAYADHGNTSSNTVILFLHGAFAVGDASRPPRTLLDKHFHYVAPSLPGWGRSPPISNPSAKYASSIMKDIMALIRHLHPNFSKIKLYICGHSFGTVTASILYGASYDEFPLGRSIAGMMLIAPHSAPHRNPSYSKSMSWRSYFMTGPPTRFLPPIMPRLAQYSLSSIFKSEESAEKYVRNTLYTFRTVGEKEAYAKWCEDYEVPDGKIQSEATAIISRSIANTWRGFTDIPAIYHSGWGGVCPDKLDQEHYRPPVLLVSGSDDNMIPRAYAEWMEKAYKGSRLKLLEGGHMSAFFMLDDLWTELFLMEDERSQV